VYNVHVCVCVCVWCAKARIVDDRKAVQQADRVGLPLKTDGRHTQTLTTEFIAEALTISDLFELNEVASVELLLAGYQRSLCIRDVNETRDSKKILDLENYISRPSRIPRI